MERAYSTVEYRTYEALQFSQMRGEKIEAMRHDLICCDCKGQASFRSKSKNGRVACFTAYHLDSCDIKGWSDTDRRKNSIDAIEEAKKIYASDALIQIAPMKHGGPINLSGHATPRIDPNGRVSTTHTKSPPRSTPTRRSYAALLHLLAKTDDFATSNARIQISRTTSTVRDGCVNFSDLSDEHISNRPRYFWGILSSVSRDLKWLRARNSVDFSIFAEKIKPVLKTSYGLTTQTDFEGALFICCGWLKRSKSGNLIIWIAEKPKENFYIEPLD